MKITKQFMEKALALGCTKEKAAAIYRMACLEARSAVEAEGYDPDSINALEDEMIQEFARWSK